MVNILIINAHKLQGRFIKKTLFLRIKESLYGLAEKGKANK